MTKTGKLTLLGITLLMILSTLSVNAGDILLNNNTGTTNVEWFITGEYSLVMNGFSLNTALPAAIEKVSLSVASPTPGIPVNIVIYQDANGGSPVDAVLVSQAEVDITQPGLFTYTFETPVIITQPVVWIGFYLPVDFRFFGDNSGQSVLTYWAWSAGKRFDLAALSSAEVLGPADGTAPVNINMRGIARITAEARSATSAEATQEAVPAPAGISQVVGSAPSSLIPPLQPYEFCSPVLIDTDDVSITLQEKVRFYCSVMFEGFSPTDPPGYERRGFLYDVFVFGATVSSTKLPAYVTHCIRPAPEDLNTAVIGIAQGTPRTWQILPSQRYEDLVCAELIEIGFLSYFVPTAVAQ